MEKSKNLKILSGFILKIMALVFMTFDHIGVFMNLYQKSAEIAGIFRVIGRLSFPIIIFLLVEGINHTRSFKRYFLRISIIGLIFMVGQIFASYFIVKNKEIYSPIIDLLLTASCVYLLKRKDKFSFLALIPLGWAITCLVVRNYEISHLGYVKWVPFFLRPDYSLYGPLLGIGFFYSTKLTELFLKSNQQTKNFIGTSFEQTTKNLICSIILIILTILICFIDQNGLHTYYSIPWQVYSLFAFIPILFYSGKRGYDAKWFKYGCYGYFPTHFIILYIIFDLLL